MIGGDTARRSMTDVAFKRDHDARPVQSFSNLRSGQTDYATMPTVARDDRGVTQIQVCATALKFFDCAIEDFTLRVHPLAVARIEVFGQTARFFGFFGA